MVGRRGARVNGSGKYSKTGRQRLQGKRDKLLFS